MNQYIFDQVLRHTRYHFYSQRDRHIYFLKQFREEPSGGKRNHRPAIPGPNHERCLFKAANEQQSQQNHLKERYPAATQLR
ncbi:BBL_G0000790.mRNA.1.CDS.1 [Saccharomyces cerevisiae]|nr:BBL_G0000790.mRNA.1.CDS.1 [Saccharomyces cerevisiae]CAI7035938.1 BBL_G0000790.mRNA.1.CDS.1 [Saccharomyces cerevisiae]